jgi:hypothetical protein
MDLFLPFCVRCLLFATYCFVVNAKSTKAGKTIAAKLHKTSQHWLSFIYSRKAIFETVDNTGKKKEYFF